MIVNIWGQKGGTVQTSAVIRLKYVFLPMFMHYFIYIKGVVQQIFRDTKKEKILILHWSQGLCKTKSNLRP